MVARPILGLLSSPGLPLLNHFWVASWRRELPCRAFAQGEGGGGKTPGRGAKSPTQNNPEKIIKHNVFVGGVWYIHFSVHCHFVRTINIECVSSFGVTSNLSALLSLSAVILYNLKSFVFWDSLLRQRKQILPIILQNSSNFPISKCGPTDRAGYMTIVHPTPGDPWRPKPSSVEKSNGANIIIS